MRVYRKLVVNMIAQAFNSGVYNGDLFLAQEEFCREFGGHDQGTILLLQLTRLCEQLLPVSLQGFDIDVRHTHGQVAAVSGAVTQEHFFICGPNEHKLARARLLRNSRRQPESVNRPCD